MPGTCSPLMNVFLFLQVADFCFSRLLFSISLLKYCKYNFCCGSLVTAFVKFISLVLNSGSYLFKVSEVCYGLCSCLWCSKGPIAFQFLAGLKHETKTTQNVGSFLAAVFLFCIIDSVSFLCMLVPSEVEVSRDAFPSLLVCWNQFSKNTKKRN